MTAERAATRDFEDRPAARDVAVAWLRVLWVVARDPRALLIVAGVGAAVWLVGLRRVDITRIGDLGIASMLPLWGIAGLTLLVVAFCLALVNSKSPAWLLAAILLAIIVLLYGLTAMLEHEARFAAAWRHAGFTDYFLRHGSTNTRLDAYFAWPGFFVGLAFLTRASGLDTPEHLLSVANWAPLFFNLLYGLVLFAIYSSLTIDRRVRWLGLWFFFLNNWAGQDYMAPQALAYLLYLVLIWTVLRSFRTGSPWPDWLRRVARDRSETQALGRRIRLAPLVVVVALFTALVVSHPLTPFFTIAAVIVLVIFAGVRPWWLPVTLLGIVAVWDALTMRDFLAGHSEVLTSIWSGISGKLDQNLAARIVGSPEHLFIVRLRLVMTGVLWALGGLGALRLWRSRATQLTAVMLALAPLSMVPLQAYGGEMLIRAEFFALPFVTFLAAQLFYPLPKSRDSGRKTAALVLMSIVMLGAFLFTRFGNERQDYMSTGEVKASHYLYAVANPGTLLVWAPNLPVKYRDIENFLYDDISAKDLKTLDVKAFETRLRSRNLEAHIVITRSAKAAVDMSSGQKPGSLDRFQAALQADPNFQVVFHNQDAEIFFLDRGTQKP
jgi:hypothetical protein